MGRNSRFQFQEFSIVQEKSAMKISTDAILLGTLAEYHLPARILDIGTGTGVVGLMLAQRYEEARVTGVELDQDAAEEAQANFEASRFHGRLQVWQGMIQEFDPEERFDLVVSNPPFFPDHLKSTNPKRNQALHTDKLSFKELTGAVTKLMNSDGSFWVILPPRQLEELKSVCTEAGLLPFREIAIRDNPSKAVHRKVCGFGRSQQSIQVVEESLKDEEGNYTEFYKGLLSGFLLGY